MLALIFLGLGFWYLSTSPNSKTNMLVSFSAAPFFILGTLFHELVVMTSLGFLLVALVIAPPKRNSGEPISISRSKVLKAVIPATIIYFSISLVEYAIYKPGFIIHPPMASRNFSDLLITCWNGFFFFGVTFTAFFGGAFYGLEKVELVNLSTALNFGGFAFCIWCALFLGSAWTIKKRGYHPIPIVGIGISISMMSLGIGVGSFRAISHGVLYGWGTPWYLAIGNFFYTILIGLLAYWLSQGYSRRKWVLQGVKLVIIITILVNFWGVFTTLKESWFNRHNFAVEVRSVSDFFKTHREFAYGGSLEPRDAAFDLLMWRYSNAREDKNSLYLHTVKDQLWLGKLNVPSVLSTEPISFHDQTIRFPRINLHVHDEDHSFLSSNSFFLSKSGFEEGMLIVRIEKGCEGGIILDYQDRRNFSFLVINKSGCHLRQFKDGAITAIISKNFFWNQPNIRTIKIVKTSKGFIVFRFTNNFSDTRG